MRITVNDSRSFAVIIALSETNSFYNWSTRTFEQPFDNVKHTKPLPAMIPPFNTVQSINIGDVLLTYEGASALLVALDASGNALFPTVDAWTLPYNTPVCGGFNR